MLVEPIVKSSRPAWQEQIDRQLKPVGAPTPIASFNRLDDIDPDPPPSAVAALPWPRDFPGL
jgi:hypothetical protein